MRVAIIADSHFRKRQRFEECIRIHDWIADDVRARAVDLIVHAGDVYDAETEPEERLAVARFFARLAKVAPVVVVRGNHDPVGDLPLLERLRTEHPIEVFETVGWTQVETKSGAVVLGLLGWPQRSNIAKLAAVQGHEDANLAAADALRGVFRWFGAEFERYEPASPRLVVAHAMIRASRVSTGQPLVGCDFEIGVEDLALARADFYALGHVHLAQDWTAGDAPVVYPGSPRRTNFGELEPKGYVVAEIRDRRLINWQRVETPCTPMVLLQDEWGWSDEHRCDDWLDLQGYDGPESVAGAEVKFRYKVPAAKREAAALAAEAIRTVLLEDGALSVVIEPEVVVEQRARAPEVSRATTLEEKLTALWRAKGFEPGTRREPLLAKVAELQR